MKKIGIILAVASTMLAVFATTGMISTVSAASNDCSYANFHTTAAIGVVEVCGVHPGTIGTVTVLIRSNQAGSLLLCDRNIVEGEHCSGIATGNFNAGCAVFSFQMELSPLANEPQYVDLNVQDGSFNPFASAPLGKDVNKRDLKQFLKNCF